MKSKTIIIFLIISMYGCSQNIDKYVITKQLNQIPDYPAIEVNTELFTINDSIPLAPEKIWVEDTLLIIETQYNNGFLRLYSLNSGALVKSYGHIGNGPGEYLYPQIFRNGKGTYIIADRLRFGIVNIEQL